MPIALRLGQLKSVLAIVNCASAHGQLGLETTVWQDTKEENAIPIVVS